jgi:hypothetical protein
MGTETGVLPRGTLAITLYPYARGKIKTTVTIGDTFTGGVEAFLYSTECAREDREVVQVLVM